ncbi:MAG TPA: hypothetical protein VFK41_11745 [Nocardioidaceae bacterium]|nr:hypothetical protein [Nocardioidaceae bacterium]
MRARRILTPVLVALGLSLGTVSPAQAVEPGISFDTSVPGQVTITTTGMADGQAIVGIGNETGLYAVSETLNVSGGGLQKTFATWGLGGQAQASVWFCPTGQGCDYAFANEPFTPSDVAPVVTWPAVSVIGPDGPTFPVTVSDTSGGGVLRAVYDGAREVLARSGQTVLTFPSVENASGTVVVLRCKDDSEEFCAETGVVSDTLGVRRAIPLQVSMDPTGATTAVGATYRTDGVAETPDVRLTLYTTDLGGYDFTWSVSQNGTPVGGLGGTVPVTVVQEADETPHAFVDLDLTGLGSGSYVIHRHLAREYVGAGVIEGEQDASFDIDVTGPSAGVLVNRSTFYPVVDGYLDKVGLTATTSNDEYNPTGEIEIRSSLGALVHSFEAPGTRMDWNGRNGGGQLLPAGTYTVTAVVTDRLGNETSSASKSLVLSHKKLVAKTFKKTIAAAKTLEKAFVGKCSSLVRGVRGWSGSLGLHTNTKCKGNFKESLVETIHATKVPAAHSYGDLRISTYGGNAKSMPGSYLFFDMLTNKGEWGSRDTRLGYNVGLHAGPRKKGANYVWGDRYVVWDVYTWGPARYDVKSFTITLKYTVLQ